MTPKDALIEKMAFRTYRYRVKDGAAENDLCAAARAVNLVWNYCNEAQVHVVRHNQAWTTKAKMFAMTAGASKELKVPAQTVQAVVEAYHDKRRSAHKARLRWRGHRSLGWVPFKNQTVGVTAAGIRFNGRIIRIWQHRQPVGVLKSGSFSQDARGRWYCNLVYENPIASTCGMGAVGIDLGLKDGLSLSTGEKVENSRLLVRRIDDLAAAQRARKKRRVAAIHAKIADSRRDFLHKATSRIVDTNALICVGNVSATWLQKTAGKSAIDASIGISRSMLRYKAIARGAVFVDVSEYLTTQVCSDCGSIGGPKGLEGLEIREWRCGECGAVHDRDVNAARNILRLGHQTLAEGSPNHMGGCHEAEHEGPRRP